MRCGGFFRSSAWERSTAFDCDNRLAKTPAARCGLFAAVILAAFSSDGAFSQTKTIKIVIPFPAGGSADSLMRLSTDHISRAQNVTFVIENRPGAGTVIATEAVSRAEPDGTTLLTNANSFVINPHLRKLTYDPLTAFEPICYLVSSPQVVVVNSTSNYRTLADLVQAARVKPGELTMASLGPATAQHVAVEQFKRAAGINMTFLPYPGNVPAVTALLGGHVTSGPGELRRSRQPVAGRQIAGTCYYVEVPHRPAASSANRRGAGLSGLRSDGLARSGGASENTTGGDHEARQMVCGGDRGPRGETQAARFGSVSGRTMRRIVRALPASTI